MLNIPLKEEADDFERHSLWLTREKTEAVVGDGLLSFGRGKDSDLPERRAYLQLDVLKAGDVFVSIHVVSTW